MSASLSSLWGAGAQLFDNKGLPLSGGFINTYLAGSTTPATTWNSSSQTVANANPIQLDSSGRTTGPIYLIDSQGYKFIVTDSVGGSIGPTWDNIFSIGTNAGGGGGGGGTTSPWVASGLTPTYVSSSSFTVSGNQTAVFPIGTRIKATVTGGTVYGTVTAVAFTSSTLVTIRPDVLALDNGLSTVFTSLLTQQSSYAQGTFTPTLKWVGVAQSTSIAQGEFTQVGNMVFFTIRVAKTNGGSPTGAVTIGGVPFTSSASYTYLQNVSMITPGGNYPAGLTGMHGEISAGDVQMYYSTPSTMYNTLDAAIFGNSGSTNLFVTGMIFLS